MFKIVVTAVCLIVCSLPMFSYAQNGAKLNADEQQTARNADVKDSSAPDLADGSSKLIPRHCPFIWELTKKDLHWATKDGKWKSNDPYFPTGIEAFIGAQ